MGKIIRNNIEYSSSSNSAGNISYDNSASNLNSLTVQNAITELDGLVGEKLTQYSVMPTASAEYVGKVVQFIGTTDQDYTNGYFYVCVQLGTMSSITYSWINVNVTDIEFDTTPTSGSANAVTSDGIYSLVHKGSGQHSIAFGAVSSSSGTGSIGIGYGVNANQNYMTAAGKYNNPRTNDIFEIGNGTGNSNRSNIVEVNSTSLNVNGAITQNGTPVLTSAGTLPVFSYDPATKTLTYTAGSLPSA